MKKLSKEQGKTLIAAAVEEGRSALQWIEFSGIAKDSDLRFAYMHLDGVERTTVRGIDNADTEEETTVQSGGQERKPNGS